MTSRSAALAAAAATMLVAGCAAAGDAPTVWHSGQPSAAASRSSGPPPKIATDNGVRGPLGDVIDIGVRDATGSAYVIYGVTGGVVNDGSPFGFAIGLRQPRNVVTEDETISEYQRPATTPGFHAFRGQVGLDGGNVQPAFGYYVGTPASITVAEAGATFKARFAPWSNDPGITVFWFDPDPALDNATWATLSAFDAAGNRMPGQDGTTAEPSQLPPTFPELTGDTGTTVRLLSVDFKTRAAVVEPIMFLPGPDYCTKLHIPRTDTRCVQDYVIENSNTKVTLPIAEKVKLTNIGDGSDDCYGTMTTGATCPATEADYTKAVRPDADMLVYLKLQSGTIARIAELYRP